MKKNRAIFVFTGMVAVAAFGQDRTVWRTSADVQEGTRGSIVGTVADLDEGSNRLMLTPDGAPSDQLAVETDAVTTQYNGFGGTINGSPEIFVGSTGFSNLRVGDRIEVRGTGSGNGLLRAERLTLLGRVVQADQTGIGQTRSPSSISTPTANGTTPTTAPDRLGRVEGIVQQVNVGEGRVVIVTDRREVLTVRGSSNTPVYYHGDTYHITNLEIGDHIRVEPEGGAAVTGTELRARTIDVMQSAQDARGTTPRQVGSISGRVVRIDRASGLVTIDTGRGNVTIDLTSAQDDSGRPIRARDMQAGDRVELSGSYAGSTFVATTIRFTDEAPPPAPSGNMNVTATPTPVAADLGLVTLYGTVRQTLANSPQLVIADSQNGNREIRLYAVEDLTVRTRSGGYSTADHLREKDAVVVKAYRDADGNYIAQTIRLR